MGLIASRLWHTPASGLSQLVDVLLDLSSAWRVIRIQWLRKTDRHREADRVIRAVQREFEARRRS